jgi:hypothetical protein
MTTRGESRSRRNPTQEEAREPAQHRRKRGGGEQPAQGEQENEVKKQNPEERRIIRYKYRQFKQAMAGRHYALHYMQCVDFVCFFIYVWYVDCGGWRITLFMSPS